MFRSLLLACFLTSVLYAEGIDVEVKPTGYGILEVGQVVRGLFRQQGDQVPDTIDHIWQQNVFGGIGLNANIGEYLSINLAGEGRVAFSMPQLGTAPVTMMPRNSFYIKRADAAVSFGDVESFFFHLFDTFESLGVPPKRVSQKKFRLLRRFDLNTVLSQLPRCAVIPA